MQISIRASYDSFRELRESGAYYVDKTELLDEYLARRFDKTVLFTRPRRFGKTMTMTMFRDFLDVRQDSREIFSGLKIMGCADTVATYMNQYPVVFLSLKEVFGRDFDAIFDAFRIICANACKAFNDLSDSNRIDSDDRDTFLAVKGQKANEANTVAVLDLLARMLRAHYGRPAFIIIDEYDVPMAKSVGTPAYDKVRDLVEHMLSYVCKTNENVKAVILSGCLYTVKNSTYTGVNNIIPYTMLSSVFASSIGFTDDEVRRIIRDAGLDDRYETVKEWYDGYLFGRNKMYCPWDVLQYVRSVLDGSYSEVMGPESYWLNTSETTPAMIHGFLGKTTDANESFERLLAGESIECLINENLPYHRIYENGDNLWSALLETGYLTKTVEEKMTPLPLRIPNKSIRAAFRQEVWEFFKDKVDNIYIRDFMRAMWTGETERAQSALCQILEATLSFYHEYHEYSYHLILDGFFTGMGCIVFSELETGYGRSDLIILDPARNRCLILELKHVQKESGLKAALREAESQIIKNKYESRLIYQGYTARLRYGMAFYDKQALIAKVV